MKALVETMDNMGNPFSDTSGDLLVLDTREVMDAAVHNSVRNLQEIGKRQCNEFFSRRLVERTTPLSDRIPKNNLSLFSWRPDKAKTRTQEQRLSMKRDRHLFATLYIASQVRDADLEEFFQHENQSWPPSISDYGKLRSVTKSDLLPCLEDLLPQTDEANNLVPEVDMIVLDGAVIVNMIKPAKSNTFAEYVSEFMTYIRSQFTKSVQRVDVVFDDYRDASLKAATRMKRGTGVRIRVEGRKKLPKNWHQFLREDGNKTELFNLLSDNVTAETFPGVVVMTRGKELRCSEVVNEQGLSPCTHEEADTRMLLHAADGAKQGFKRILVRTVDTDVVVLAVSTANKLACEQLIVSFGTGKTSRYLDATLMARQLGSVKCDALPAFHALTGCDTTSGFAGRGKRTAWSVWNKFSDVTPALLTLAQTPTEAHIDEILPTIERFVIQMYDKESSDSSVNKARQTLFTQKGREIENIPPTKDALRQHVLRTGYQAGHVWGQALLKEPQLPSPDEFGWRRQNDSSQWEVKWMDLPPAGAACRAVVKCGCTKGCKGRCRCAKENLPCTMLCKCGGCKHLE